MKYTTHEICADIASTMDRVREIDIEGHARAAALQCLASARAHLTGVKQRLEVVIETPEQRKRWPVREGSILDDLAKPIQTSPFPQVALRSVQDAQQAQEDATRRVVERPVTRAYIRALDIMAGNPNPLPLDSVPPSAADNQRVRNTATQAFRSARKILEGILK